MQYTQCNQCKCSFEAPYGLNFARNLCPKCEEKGDASPIKMASNDGCAAPAILLFAMLVGLGCLLA